MRPKQQSFLPGFNSQTVSRAHGGTLVEGKRKTRRPIDPRQSLHVVLRSSLARGHLSLLHPAHSGHIHALTLRLSERWGVRLYRYANVGNHIHLLVKVPSRAVWQRFLRELAGGIAIIVTGAKKGAALAKNNAGRGFWDHLAFTRIVSAGRDFANVCRYLLKNLFEGTGVPLKRLLAQGCPILIASQSGWPEPPPFLPPSIKRTSL